MRDRSRIPDRATVNQFTVYKPPDFTWIPFDSELVGLELGEIQMRQGHWAVVDMIGKGGHIRTVPIPAWVKAALDYC